MNLIPRERETREPMGFLDLGRGLDELFDLTPRFGAWAPAVDVHETEEEVIVRADLPGMKKEEIEANVQDGVLTIRGEKKHEAEKKSKGTVLSERFFGSFERQIALPAIVDETKAKARYADGVLEMTLPKSERAKPRRIAVE